MHIPKEILKNFRDAAQSLSKSADDAINASFWEGKAHAYQFLLELEILLEK